jgi:triacylglycerol esterase/lipase EstA (alpha/beta hydrolase family)
MLFCHTMLARLQQCVTLSMLAVAAGWLLYCRDRSIVLAISGVFLLLFGYALVLALGFLALASNNKHDAAGPPLWRDLVPAWWTECVVAAQVFYWRQPFRSLALPDYMPANGRRGVVFVHGLVCNRGLWTPWLKACRTKGIGFVAVNLEPVFGSIDGYVATVEAAVQRVTEDTGMPPVLVCHSMGGLAARAWLRAAGDDARVHRIVTIGSPHHGTRLAQFSHISNGAQMRLASGWLNRLASREAEQ